MLSYGENLQNKGSMFGGEGGMFGGNVLGKCFGEMFWGEMSGGNVGGGGERNVGIPKINSNLLARHKQLICVTQSSGS